MSLSNLFTVLFIYFVARVECNNEYGVELELLAIHLSAGDRRPDLLQYELRVETRTFPHNVQSLGSAVLRTVKGTDELVFPEVPGKNPFHVSRLESEDNLCFRLEQNLDTLADECKEIKDHFTTYYSSEVFTKNLTDGSGLSYKISQYLLKIQDFSSISDSTLSTLASASSSSPFHSTNTKFESSSSPVCAPCNCTVPIVFAGLEGAILILLVLVGLYYFIFVLYPQRKPAGASSPKRKPRPTITVVRPGSDAGGVQNVDDSVIYDDSGVSSVSSRMVQERYPSDDVRPSADGVNDKLESSPSRTLPGHLDGKSADPSSMRTIPGKLKASTLSVSSVMNSKLGEASVSMKKSLKSTGRALASTGRQIKEKVNEVNVKAKLKSNVSPPMPPPPDYPPTDRNTVNHSDDIVIDDDDEFYDVIELDEVDETAKPPPKVPENKPVNSFLYTVGDASDARNKSRKFSYM